MLFEDLKGDIHLLADAVVNTQQTLEQMVRPRVDNHEERITALELGRSPGPVRHRA